MSEFDLKKIFKCRIIPQAGDRIEAGDEIVAPAFFVYWILERQNTIQNWKAVRVCINIFAAVLTMGSSSALSPLITSIELGFNATDIAFAMSSDHVQSNWSDEYVRYFNAVEMLVSMGDVAFSLGTGYAAYSFRKSLLKNGINSRLANSDPALFNDLRGALRQGYESLKNMPPGSVTPVGRRLSLESVYRNATLHADFAQHSRLVPGADALSDVRSGRLYIESSTHSNSVGRLEQFGTGDVLV